MSSRSDVILAVVFLVLAAVALWTDSQAFSGLLCISVLYWKAAEIKDKIDEGRGL